jgi:hypothetical protein
VFFICYHHPLVIYRSYLDIYLYSCSLKIPSLPPRFESDNLPIWPLDISSSFPFAGPVLTPSFMVLISYVLCLFTSSHTSLFVNTFKNPCNIYTHVFTLTLNLPFEASPFASLSGDNASSISSPIAPPSLTPCKSYLKYILYCVFVRYHLNPCHPLNFNMMLILHLHFKASSPIPIQECCLTPPCSCSSLFSSVAWQVLS